MRSWAGHLKSHEGAFIRSAPNSSSVLMASFCMSLNPFTATLSNLSSAEANDLHQNKFFLVSSKKVCFIAS
jgi:hypothetical protein